MSKFLFRTYCPSCLDRKYVSTWIHSGCGGNFYIDENVDLTCQACGATFFALNAQINCPDHSLRYSCVRDFNEGFVISMIDIIANTENFPGMPPSIRKKMLNKLNKLLV